MRHGPNAYAILRALTRIGSSARMPPVRLSDASVPLLRVAGPPLSNVFDLFHPDDLSGLQCSRH